MVHRLHKHKLILDENFSSRQNFPNVNGMFDLKHIRDDLKLSGLPDPEVYKLAVKLKRIIRDAERLVGCLDHQQVEIAVRREAAHRHLHRVVERSGRDRDASAGIGQAGGDARRGHEAEGERRGRPGLAARSPGRSGRGGQARRQRHHARRRHRQHPAERAAGRLTPGHAIPSIRASPVRS